MPIKSFSIWYTKKILRTLEKWQRADLPNSWETDIGLIGDRIDAQNYFRLNFRDRNSLGVAVDYMTQLRYGARPIAHFSPLYYLATYPDVAAANVEPFAHYLLYGWREGRDPSPTFATNFYIEQMKRVGEAGTDPLAHYYLSGRAAGFKPHYQHDEYDILDPYVGIVIVSHNSFDALKVTLDSLRRAKNKSRAKIILIENGSTSTVKQQVSKLLEEDAVKPLQIDYHDIDRNLGYSGGNNVGIKIALAAGCTHVCLLNSDVLVTNSWLDLMLATEEPIIGPVSNAVGNEQTVPINYSFGVHDSNWDTANQFAKSWRDAFFAQVVYSKFVCFYCVLIRSDVFEKIGLLDERFYPGSYEDDDFCVRLLQANYRPSIARHVFVHHFGSASFGRLMMNDRINIGSENRERFEQKHKKVWETRSHLPALSLAQDIARVDIKRLRKGSTERFLLDVARNQAHEIGNMANQLGGEIQRLREVIASKDAQLSMAGVEIKLAHGIIKESGLPVIKDKTRAAYLSPISTQAYSPPVAFLKSEPNLVRNLYKRMIYSFGACLGVYTARLSTILSVQPLFSVIARMANGIEPIVVFANGIDPITGDERDGYVLRVKAIDDLFKDHVRIYIRIGQEEAVPTLVQLDENICRLDLYYHDELVSPLLASLIQNAAFVYVHSILSLGTPVALEAVEDFGERMIWDVHGIVPEEFELNRDFFSRQVFEDIERRVARTANRIVCVTNKMVEHIHQKYDDIRSKSIVLPIVPPNVAGATASDKRISIPPRVIYAGGTQDWQQVSKMLDFIVALRGKLDFVILTPGVDTFVAGLVERGISGSDVRTFVKSASHAEVQAMYSKCDFGLILREDIDVNRVACPTKLVEYLAFGVIPVVDSPHIGDFIELGMQYIVFSDMMSGNWPTEEDRIRIVENNHKVFTRLIDQQIKGSDSLFALMAQDTSNTESANG